MLCVYNLSGAMASEYLCSKLRQCYHDLSLWYIPSLDGKGIVLIIFSIWLRVDDPGNKGFPPSISPRIHPSDHMSTPFVYLKM